MKKITIYFVFSLLIFICCGSKFNQSRINYHQDYSNERIFLLSNPYYEDSVRVYLPKNIKLEFEKEISSADIQYFENKKIIGLLTDYTFFTKANKEFFPTSGIRFEKDSDYNLDLLLYKNINISYNELTQVLKKMNMESKQKRFRDTVFVGGIKDFKIIKPDLFNKLNSKNDTLLIYYSKKGDRKFKFEKFRIDW